ncbi:MAG: Alpha-phosphoglucomutase, partial [Candidatus Moranbacteria bacterium GW2011_GWF1_36_4]
MGIVVRDKNGEYDIITGNQIGSIMEYYILTQKKEKNIMPKNPAIVKTIVTTNLQDDIANSFGIKIFNVLTGFKFIGQKIREFEDDKSYNYVFGGEESYGYLTGTHARDKDAIAATLMISEIAAYLKNKNLTFISYLEEIYSKFGYYDEDTVSKTIKGLKGIEVIKSIMQNYREKKIEQI